MLNFVKNNYFLKIAKKIFPFEFYIKKKLKFPCK